MKGKRLISLLNSLNRSEIMRLHHLCNGATDKRYLYLKDLLAVKNDIGLFNEYLNGIGKRGLKQGDETSDKTVHRFVDFSIQLLENLLLEEFMNPAKDPVQRYSLMADIFFLRNQFDLFHYYSDRLWPLLESRDKISNKLKIIEYKLKWLGNIQQDSELSQIKSLVESQIKLAKIQYYQYITNSYMFLSSLYFDNLDVKEDVFSLLPPLDELDLLAKQAPEPHFAIQLRMTQARLTFDQKDLFYHYQDEAEKLFSDFEPQLSNSIRNQRSISMQRLVMGIYYDLPLSELLPSAEKVSECNKKLNYIDSTGQFWFLFLKLLNGEVDFVKKALEGDFAPYFYKENQFYHIFLDATLLFKEKNYNNALDKLQDISYGKNIYIAIWSKLLEIHIHIRLGNYRLAETLLARAKRYLLQHQNRPFAYYPNLKVLRLLEKANQGEYLPQENQMYEFSRLLLDFK